MFKKFISPILVAATLAAGVSVTSPQETQAGIILAPFVIGIVLIVVGIEENRLGLLVLGQDGLANRDQLSAKLQEKYGLEDQAVAQQFADVIRSKAAVAPVDTKGAKTVTLSRDEVMNILAPTGLDDLNPNLVEQMVSDFGA